MISWKLLIDTVKLNEDVKQEKCEFGIQDLGNTIQEKGMKDSPEWKLREILRQMKEKVTSPC